MDFLGPPSVGPPQNASVETPYCPGTGKLRFSNFWVLDSESGYFGDFQVFTQNVCFFKGYMSKKSRDPFSGEKKAPAAMLLGVWSFLEGPEN